MRANCRNAFFNDYLLDYFIIIFPWRCRMHPITRGKIVFIHRTRSGNGQGVPIQRPSGILATRASQNRLVFPRDNFAALLGLSGRGSQILPHRLPIGKGHRCHGQQDRRRQETCQ